MNQNNFIKQRIVFMGSPAFAVPSLQVLIDSGHHIVAVYTQAPKAKNRGHAVQQTPVHIVAQHNNIPVYTPKSLRSEDVQQIFADHHADIGVVAAYGLILPKQILYAPRLGCVNVHASLLPKWRGAAPIHRAIMAGDTETGITLMQMDEGLDTGDMLAKASIPIPADMTTPVLHDQLSYLGAQLLKDNLSDLFEGALRPVGQSENDVSYASKLCKEESRIEFHESAQSIEAKVRALNPWPGVSFDFQEVMIKIHHSTVIDNIDCSILDSLNVGSFLSTQQHPLCAVCGDKTLLSLDRLQRPGGKPLEANDFLSGFEQLRHACTLKI